MFKESEFAEYFKMKLGYEVLRERCLGGTSTPFTDAEIELWAKAHYVIGSRYGVNPAELEVVMNIALAELLSGGMLEQIAGEFASNKATKPITHLVPILNGLKVLYRRECLLSGALTADEFLSFYSLLERVVSGAETSVIDMNKNMAHLQGLAHKMASSHTGKVKYDTPDGQ